MTNTVVNGKLLVRAYTEQSDDQQSPKKWCEDMLLSTCDLHLWEAKVGVPQFLFGISLITKIKIVLR